MTSYVHDVWSCWQQQPHHAPVAEAHDVECCTMSTRRRPSEEHLPLDSVITHTVLASTALLLNHHTRDGQSWLAFHMQVSCRRVRSTTHSGVGGQTGSVQIWSTIHQQLRVPDLPPDMSLTDWASCPQQVTLVMMRPVVSTAQSMRLLNQQNLGKFWEVLELDFKLFSLLILVVHTLSLRNQSDATLASLSISIYPRWYPRW